MSLSKQIKRLASNNPPVTDPDLFARECAEELGSHQRSDALYAGVMGGLWLVGLVTHIDIIAGFFGMFLFFSLPFLVRNYLLRGRLRKALTTQYPDAALKAGISTSSKDADVPSYARKK